jgi:ABC-type multidrug transport system fused ATPase/permease subunit
MQLKGLYVADKHLTLDVLFLGLQIAASLCAIISNLLVPRRPELFHHGIPVDREYSTSYLGWLTFSWLAPWLNTMRTSTVRISNLPQLGYSLRAENAVCTCYQMMGSVTAGAQGLWVVILRSELGLLSLQGIITLGSSILGFVPQFAVMRILGTLEKSQQGERDEARLYTFLVLLCTSTMAAAILDSIKNWISYGKLAVRVQQRLTVAIFEKAVRRSVGAACTSRTGGAKGDDLDGPLNHISLAAVDAKSIADFVCMTFQLYETPAKLLVASVFLWTLLGWQGLLACGVVLILTSCANSYTVKKYSQSQRNLHQVRDQRLTLVTEVIRGIQNVKFAALEDRWEERVSELRGQEMRAQWFTYLWQTAMFSLYFLSPILLSIAALGVALLINGDLTATTAFTTISVLNSIEMSLCVLPDIASMFASAFVSMQRLSRFFAEPSHVSNVIPSAVIEFRDATLAWPSSPASLSGVNLTFPTGALSVITGATGTGKSLLLTAILGESDLLVGTIRAPSPLANQSKPSKCSQGGIAYVPQAPWIERGTIRDNILFGSPFSSDRYALVLFACALEKDLEQLPAGDMTGIGTDGVNLSGGQRWRVSLARALYSSAQTLLLDDFFSAVDVHTRAHLHRHALMGEIARGRTRILVTHHVDICLPSAEYLVSLGNGTAVTMSVEDARREQLGKVQPVATANNESLQELEPQIEQTQPPRRDDEDDEEIVGLNRDALRAYATQGGSPFFWVLVIASFVAYSGLLLGKVIYLHSFFRCSIGCS